MNLKKILIILVAVLVVAVTALVVYNFFLKDDTVVESNEEETENEVYEPTYAASSNLATLSLKPVLGVAISDNKVKYYLAENGNVYESDLNGLQNKLLSGVELSGLIKVLWSPSGNKVITLVEKNNQVEKYFYDYATKLSKPLNKSIEWLNWAKKEDKIAYQYYNSLTDDSNISISNPDGSNWSRLMFTRMKDLVVNWPTPDLISLMTKPSGFSQGTLYTLNKNSKNFEKVIQETFGLTVLWSPQGDKILFSETDLEGQNLKLKLLNLGDRSVKELDATTLPEKCAWSQDNQIIFCAVPTAIPEKAALPDDYWKNKIAFSDKIWKINTKTGKSEQIFAPDGSALYNIKELLLSPDENFVVFTNYDGLLYSLSL